MAEVETDVIPRQLNGLTSPVSEYENLLQEMLVLSTTEWISAACRLVWPKPDAEFVSKFFSVLAQACAHCFQKALQATSGAKLKAPVRRLIKFINQGDRALSTGDKMIRKLRG